MCRYDEFAESVWVDSDSRPTLEDTKAHSKGVRTTEGARMYSRQYRALQKAVQGMQIQGCMFMSCWQEELHTNLRPNEPFQPLHSALNAFWVFKGC